MEGVGELDDIKYIQSFAKVYIRFALYEVETKMGSFHTSFWLCKSTATLLPTKYVLSINETF